MFQRLCEFRLKLNMQSELDIHNALVYNLHLLEAKYSCNLTKLNIQFVIRSSNCEKSP